MAVPRSRWTDERLDELAERVMRQDVLEARFDALEGRFDRLEHRFDRVEANLDAFRIEMRMELSSIRSDLFDTRRWAMALWATGVLALIGLFVEISLRT